MTEEPQSFVLIQKPVEAMQHDGTTARAYEILAWVYRVGGTGVFKDGYEEQGPDLLYVGSDESPVLDRQWVVNIPGQGISKMDEATFSSTYEPVLKDVSSV